MRPSALANIKRGVVRPFWAAKAADVGRMAIRSLLGLGENTLVTFASDHGADCADIGEGIIGKPAEYMYPGTMSIPLLLRHPQGAGAGQVYDGLVHATDMPATVMAAPGVSPLCDLDGQDLLRLVADREGWQPRAHLTCRYGSSAWCRDERSWFFGTADRRGPRVFDLETDPSCRHNIAGRASDRIAVAREQILAGAGGNLQLCRHENATDALG